MNELDHLRGVVTEVSKWDVAVSLFAGDEELSLNVPRATFDLAEIVPHEGLGVDFWVEYSADATDPPRVRALPWDELSADERRQIDAQIEELTQEPDDG